MTEKSLTNYFCLNRRYYRSINLVRDLDKRESVQGYIPTERSTDALRRILTALGSPDITHRAWTLTGVYGTGKSAFAQFLLSLCADDQKPVKAEALDIAREAFPVDSPEWKAIQENIPTTGLLRVVAVGQREPLSWTIARALVDTAKRFWKGQKRKPRFWSELTTDWKRSLERTTHTPDITNQQVLDMLKAMVEATEIPLLLVIDELGKSLEYAAQNQGVQDLYLLQQISELELEGVHPSLARLILRSSHSDKHIAA